MLTTTKKTKNGQINLGFAHVALDVEHDIHWNNDFHYASKSAPKKTIFIVSQRVSLWTNVVEVPLEGGWHPQTLKP